MVANSKYLQHKQQWYIAVIILIRLFSWVMVKIRDLGVTDSYDLQISLMLEAACFIFAAEMVGTNLNKS